MKKILVLLSIIMLTFTGCGTEMNETALIEEVNSLKTEVAELEAYKILLETDIESIRETEGLQTYVLTLSIKQTHFSLNLEDHMKDAMNELEFDIPVSKEFYDSVEKGDTLDDSFRMGSFLMKGSFGSWKVKVKDKYTE